MCDFAPRNCLAALRILKALRQGGRDMRAKRRTNRSACRIVLIAATLVVGACDAVNEAVDAIDDIGNDADVHYYVSLGTSLSIGIQPNSSGVLLPTDDGYADQLFDGIRPAFEAAAAAQPRELRLVKLGCAGETLDDMMNGGSCPYFAGSQLEAAVDFLNDNRGKVHLVTIDMGANDFVNAGCIGAIDYLDCTNAVSTQIAIDLATVLTALRDAAGPGTTIVGMNYYNPYLASWLVDAAGQSLAVESSQAAVILNDFLSNTYVTAGIPMANVYVAFQSDDFTTMVNNVPVNVANICEWTYMCDADPVGPDIHANFAGYGQIADTIAAVLP